MKKVIIIGAGPAGLTAALELLNRSSDYQPIILESSQEIGGISKTSQYKGNRIDIGGHRFFSKSDRVMNWWLEYFPPEDSQEKSPRNEVMLLRHRVSRIFFLRKFFDYPITLNRNTIRNLGFRRMIRIGLSYICSTIRPIKKEKSLEDFFINRFGRELYRTFFKDYTEKVWGVPCSEIKPEWGAQRIKGLSVTKTLSHALIKLLHLKPSKVETSLIEKFHYPKYGPGQFWEHIATLIQSLGGEIHLGTQVTQLEGEESSPHLPPLIHRVIAKKDSQEKPLTFEADYFFSSMPVKDLISGLSISKKNPDQGQEKDPNTGRDKEEVEKTQHRLQGVPLRVREVASGLIYRDFLTVGLLAKKLKMAQGNHPVGIPDNWIYIQERDVQLGRLQIFNNWSPWMVKDPSLVWMGLEYFCQEGDALWTMKDPDLITLAQRELAKINIVEEKDVLDGVVIRMPKAYPAYFGTYDHFHWIRNFLDPIENLFLIGRNGMHRYNNSDHSMLSAMVAVDNLLSGQTSKDKIWSINTEEDYHEEKKQGPEGQTLTQV